MLSAWHATLLIANDAPGLSGNSALKKSASKLKYAQKQPAFFAAHERSMQKHARTRQSKVRFSGVPERQRQRQQRQRRQQCTQVDVEIAEGARSAPPPSERAEFENDADEEQSSEEILGDDDDSTPMRTHAESDPPRRARACSRFSNVDVFALALTILGGTTLALVLAWVVCEMTR